MIDNLKKLSENERDSLVMKGSFVLTMATQGQPTFFLIRFHKLVIIESATPELTWQEKILTGVFEAKVI